MSDDKDFDRDVILSNMLNKKPKTQEELKVERQQLEEFQKNIQKYAKDVKPKQSKK